MDWPVFGKTAICDPLAECDEPLNEEVGEYVGAFPVLAKFPNLSQEETAEEDEKSERHWLGQPFRFRLLAGLGILLVVAAVLPAVFGKKGFVGSTATARSDGPSWMPGTPAPNADVAPTWTATTVVAQSQKKPEKVSNAVVAESNPAASIANAATAIGSMDSARSAMALNEVAQAASASIAKANTATQIGAATPMGDGESMPLTWDHFSRQYDARLAANSPEKKLQPNLNTVPSEPRAECQTSPYPATNTPDMLTVGPATAATTDRTSSGYSIRK